MLRKMQNSVKLANYKSYKMSKNGKIKYFCRKQLKTVKFFQLGRAWHKMVEKHSDVFCKDPV